MNKLEKIINKSPNDIRENKLYAIQKLDISKNTSISNISFHEEEWIINEAPQKDEFNLDEES